MVDEKAERKVIKWSKLFSMILTPFEGNCFILLKSTNGVIEVKAVAADPDSKKELDYIM